MHARQQLPGRPLPGQQFRPTIVWPAIARPASNCPANNSGQQLRGRPLPGQQLHGHQGEPRKRPVSAEKEHAEIWPRGPRSSPAQAPPAARQWWPPRQGQVARPRGPPPRRKEARARAPRRKCPRRPSLDRPPWGKSAPPPCMRAHETNCPANNCAANNCAANYAGARPAAPGWARRSKPRRKDARLGANNLRMSDSSVQSSVN